MGKFPFMREEENKKTNKLLRRVISRSWIIFLFKQVER
jgi:hypothetical protein